MEWIFNHTRIGYSGPVNYSFHAGNTLHGQGAQCIGFPIVPISATGNLFTTCTGSWKRTGTNSYKLVYTDVGVNPTVINNGTNAVLPTTVAGRTGFFATSFSLNNCDKVIINGKIGLYDASDPTLKLAPLAGPFDATLTLFRLDL